MLKRLFLKFVVNDIIKKMPKYKVQAKDIVDNNIDGFLDKIEEFIETQLLNIIAKKENK